MGLGWYWCRECSDWRKLHETNPPFVGPCTHRFAHLIDKENLYYHTDDSFEQALDDGSLTKKTEEIYYYLNSPANKEEEIYET